MNLNTIIYLLEVSVLTSIFYLFYRYLYFKLAYFEWSRYYLIFILITGIIIPLLPGIFSAESIKTNVLHLLNVSNSGSLNGFVQVDNNFVSKQTDFFQNIPIVKVLLVIWISGVLRYFSLIIRNLFSVYKLIKKGRKVKHDQFTIIKTEFTGSAFSFFNLIFINSEFENLNKKEQEQILLHEKIHARQVHSLDNLIFELFRAAFWFNPVSKLIAGDIKIVHEFIVDNVLTENKNKPDYSKLIIKLSLQNSNLLPVSNFSKEEIKNRLKLISYPENEKIRKRRFIISIPVLIIIIFASWFIVSSGNIYFKNHKPAHKTYHKPFDEKSYKVISPFFENDEINGISVSHKEVTYEVKSFSNVYALEQGIISGTEINDIFGLKEAIITEKLNDDFTVKYSGLFQSFFQIGDSVTKGEIIGKTGDVRLYPSVSIKVFTKNKAINPEDLY